MNYPHFVETRNVHEANEILAGGLYRREKVTDDGKYILVRRARPVKKEEA